MKKRIGAFLVIFMALSMLCGITAFAVHINPIHVNPRYSYTAMASSTLSFNGNTAHCFSSCTGMSVATGIEGTQYLEKKVGKDDWEVVKYCNWYKMNPARTLEIENNKEVSERGTYRVRTEFTVYSGSNNEPVTAISNEVKY